MISIIVPIYNAEPYLEACTTSLLQQGEVQVILVDDGSTDGSLALAGELAAQDSRIAVSTQAHAGQSAARNLGLAHATGEYIAFVDADDCLAPDWCARHMAAIDGADYVQSGYRRVRGAEAGKKQTPRHRYQFTSPCMRLYRREAIEGMRFEEGMIYEDVIWSVDLWARDLRCRRIGYAGYLYTVNPDSTTSRPHPEAQRRLFETLHRRAAKASLRTRAIIAYTVIRLKIHFLLS